MEVDQSSGRVDSILEVESRAKVDFPRKRFHVELLNPLERRRRFLSFWREVSRTVRERDMKVGDCGESERFNSSPT